MSLHFGKTFINSFGIQDRAAAPQTYKTSPVYEDKAYESGLCKAKSRPFSFKRSSGDLRPHS